MEKDYLTIKEAAKILDVHPDTVRRRINAGELKAEKLPGPFGLQYYIHESEINTAMEIINVVPVERKVSMQELAAAIDHLVAARLDVMQRNMDETMQAMQQEIEGLQQELAATREQIQQGHMHIHKQIADWATVTIEQQAEQIEEITNKKRWWQFWK